MSQLRLLASYPKSGNTWVRLLWEAYLTGRADINTTLMSTGDSNPFYYQLASCKPAHQLEMYDWAAVRVAALYNMATMQTNPNMLVKTHNIHANIGDIPLFPQSFVKNPVYLVRDPRTLVPSWASHLGKSLDDTIDNMGRSGFGTGATDDPERPQVQGLFGSWSQHVTAWSKFPNVLIVKYEDLQADPVKWFGEIVKHYDLDNYEYAQEKVDSAVGLCELSKLQAQEAKSGFKEASGHTAFFGHEREQLDAAQRRRVEELCAEGMALMGYEFDKAEVA